MDDTTTKWPTPSEVTAFFDTSLLEGADVSRLLQKSAIFVGAPVGRIRTDGHGISYAAVGIEQGHRPPMSARRTRLATGGHVWVDGLPETLASHFLGRLAVTIAIIERWGITGTSAHMRPIDVLIDQSMSTSAKAAARTQLGLSCESRVRIAICSGPSEQIEQLVSTIDAVEKVLARTTRNGRTILLLTASQTISVEISGVPVGVRAAYGRATPAINVELTYTNARDAFRFTLPSTHQRGPYQAVAGVWLNGSRISGLQALCRLSYEDIEMVPEIKELDALAEQHGPQILTMLEAYAITNSVRKAADQVHMHHNSVAYWVQKTESELGYSLTEPYRRAQLFITLCLYRLWRDRDNESV